MHVQVLGALPPQWRSRSRCGCIDDWVTATAAAEAAEAAELQLLEAQARCEHAASSLRHANAMHTHYIQHTARHANGNAAMPMPCTSCHVYVHAHASYQAALAEAKQAAWQRQAPQRPAAAAPAAAAKGKANLGGRYRLALGSHHSWVLGVVCAVRVEAGGTAGAGASREWLGV